MTSCIYNNSASIDEEINEYERLALRYIKLFEATHNNLKQTSASIYFSFKNKQRFFGVDHLNMGDKLILNYNMVYHDEDAPHTCIHRIRQAKVFDRIYEETYMKKEFTNYPRHIFWKTPNGDFFRILDHFIICSKRYYYIYMAVVIKNKMSEESKKSLKVKHIIIPYKSMKNAIALSKWSRNDEKLLNTLPLDCAQYFLEPLGWSMVDKSGIYALYNKMCQDALGDLHTKPRNSVTCNMIEDILFNPTKCQTAKINEIKIIADDLSVVDLSGNTDNKKQSLDPRIIEITSKALKYNKMMMEKKRRQILSSNASNKKSLLSKLYDNSGLKISKKQKRAARRKMNKKLKKSNNMPPADLPDKPPEN